MKPSLVFSAALRESRGARARLVFFIACLALGVAAITGVNALVASIEDALRSQSRELLGADIAIDARREIPSEIDRLITPAVDARADVRELATLAKHANHSALVELKAISANFPFHGEVVLDRAGRLGDLLDANGCALAPEALRQLGAQVGDTLSLGGESFTIVASVLDEPGRLDIGFTLGPRAFVSLDGLARTNLTQFGSRIRYRALYRVETEDIESLEMLVRLRIEQEIADSEYLRVQTYRDAQPTVRRSLRNVERYLGLAALLSLILGGTGVAQIVRAWLAARTQSVAVMRVIGFRPREVLAMYLGHVALFAVVGSTLGAFAGSLLPFTIPAFAPELLPSGFEIVWEPLSVARGVAFGLAIALVFSVPPLTAIWRVAPARVLRNDAEPLPAPRVIACSAYVVLLGGVFATAWAQAGELDLAAGFTGGLIALAALLSLGARALTKLAAFVPRARLGPYWRHGIAALARPGIGITAATVALGLGVLVVAAMLLVEQRLTSYLRTALPKDAPSMFLIDVQPDQAPALEEKLRSLDARSVESVPVVTARLSAIDGVEVQQLINQSRGDSGRRRPSWVFTREQRLTWRSELARDNRVVEGELWSDPQRFEVSLEQDFADDLDVHVGSSLTFDVQGVPVELAVTSIRTVEWESFGINFFLVAEPGALDGAPHARLIAARLEPEAETRLQNAIASDFPNVTPIRIRTLVEKVLAILERLALGVRALGIFSALTGLAILAGVASSSAAHRGREVALLKTLGLTRGGVARLFGLEFALIGLVAGAIGALAAFGLAWAFFELVLELEPQLPWWHLGTCMLATAAFSALCGLIANARALQNRPIESLRG